MERIEREREGIGHRTEEGQTRPIGGLSREGVGTIIIPGIHPRDQHDKATSEAILPRHQANVGCGQSNRGRGSSVSPTVIEFDFRIELISEH